MSSVKEGNRQFLRPLVSILVPCYNHEKYVGDCIESILALNYPRIEVLIVDDASADGSAAVIEKYRKRLEKKAERVVIEVNPVNLGICKNGNKLFAMAEGDYYKFIASDDFLMPNSIDILVDYFEKTPECSVVHGNVILIGENDSFFKHGGTRAINGESVPSGYHLTDQLLAGDYIYSPSMMISKRTKEEYGVYSEQYMFEDWEYLLRVSIKGKIDYVDEVLVAYRIVSGSMSHFSQTDNERRKRFLEEKIKIFEAYQEYASKKSANKFYNACIVNAYLCRDRQMVRSIYQRMRERKVKFSAKTFILIAAYRTGLFKIYKRIKERC